MNCNVFPLFPRDHGEVLYWQAEDEFNKHPIFAKDQKDVPDWLKVYHQWEPAFDVNKLQKHQLKVKMCCSKCKEIIEEEIREVRGVFDVKAERSKKKVVVVAMPSGLDEREVLKKARKIHRKAKFVELDPEEKQKTKSDNKKDEGKDGHGHGQGGKQKGKELQSTSAQSLTNVVEVPWGLQFWPLSSNPPRFHYPPSHIHHYVPGLHGQYVHFL